MISVGPCVIDGHPVVILTVLDQDNLDAKPANSIMMEPDSARHVAAQLSAAYAAFQTYGERK